MRVPFGWFVPALGAAAAGIAIWAGSNLSVALPAGALAVAAAAFLLVDAGLRSASPSRRAPAPTPTNPKRNLRAAFRSAGFGREVILDAVDRVDRILLRPELPTRSIEESQRVQRMSPEEFRAYLRDRLDAIEARS
jgi:hypothetical protein